MLAHMLYFRKFLSLIHLRHFFLWYIMGGGNNHYHSKNRPVCEILIVFALVTSKGSDMLAHMHRLARAFTVCTSS